VLVVGVGVDGSKLAEERCAAPHAHLVGKILHPENYLMMRGGGIQEALDRGDAVALVSVARVKRDTHVLETLCAHAGVTTLGRIETLLDLWRPNSEVYAQLREEMSARTTAANADPASQSRKGFFEAWGLEDDGRPWSEVVAAANADPTSPLREGFFEAWGIEDDGRPWSEVMKAAHADPASALNKGLDAWLEREGHDSMSAAMTAANADPTSPLREGFFEAWGIEDDGRPWSEVMKAAHADPASALNKGWDAAFQNGLVGTGKPRDDADRAVLRNRARSRRKAPYNKQKDRHLKAIRAMDSYRAQLAYVRKLDAWYKYAVLEYKGDKFALPASVLARLKKAIGPLSRPAPPWAGEELDMDRGVAAARGVVPSVVVAEVVPEVVPPY